VYEYSYEGYNYVKRIVKLVILARMMRHTNCNDTNCKRATLIMVITYSWTSYILPLYLIVQWINSTTSTSFI